MKFYQLRFVVMEKFRHHYTICEISTDVLFAPAKWYGIDHLIDLFQLLFIHFVNYFILNSQISINILYSSLSNFSRIKLAMIKSSTNYSIQGFNLQKRFHPTKLKPTKLKQILAERNYSKLVKARICQPKKLIETFGNLTSRDRLSPFQVAKNGKHQPFQNQYELKDQSSKLRKSMPTFSLRREKQQRLSKLMPSREFKQRQNPQTSKKCFKFEMNSKRKSAQQDYQTQNSKDTLNRNQLQKHRKSLHNFDFRKQLSRMSIEQNQWQKPKGLFPHFPDKKQLKEQYIKQVRTCKRFTERHPTLDHSNSSKTSKSFESQLLKKSFSIHSFKSYTPRTFLDPKILNQFPNSSKSGWNAYKIPLQKYKSSVKIISVPKFETLGRDQRIILRNQRVDKIWLTELDYSDAKSQLKSKIKQAGLNFKKQIPRLPINSQQKYGIRIYLNKY